MATWRELQSISAQLERAIDDVLTAEWKVPLGWFDVLAALARLGGQARPSEVADELRLVRSSLSRRLDRLEEEGWVARSKPESPDDHRAVLVVLTPRGRALWRAMNVTYRRAVQAHVSSRLSDADVGHLRRILAAVSSNGHAVAAAG
ncbi:MAG: MarR family transcriptional regulator [Actinomycetota bacterium]|nr:MarR family transcriptional regulator [Acidimicrobiia bacterium]MDQ3469010.1 MarR family transcriptional regulator [Actinomycetota bacterium]